MPTVEHLRTSTTILIMRSVLLPSRSSSRGCICRGSYDNSHLVSRKSSCTPRLHRHVSDQAFLGRHCDLSKPDAALQRGGATALQRTFADGQGRSIGKVASADWLASDPLSGRSSSAVEAPKSANLDSVTFLSPPPDFDCLFAEADPDEAALIDRRWRGLKGDASPSGRGVSEQVHRHGDQSGFAACQFADIVVPDPVLLGLCMQPPKKAICTILEPCRRLNVPCAVPGRQQQ